MHRASTELVRQSGTPPQRANRVASAVATVPPERTRTITHKTYEPQGFLDRLINGPRRAKVTREVVPLSATEIAQQTLELQQFEARSEAIDHERELATYRHYGNLKEAEVRILDFEEQAAQRRIALLDLNYQFEAAQRLWPEKEAAARTRIETENVVAQTELVRAKAALVRAEREVAQEELALKAAASPAPAARPPKQPTVLRRPKTEDQLRNLAQAHTMAALTGNVKPETWDERWLPRAGATFLERYMRTKDREMAEKDTYASVLHNLRMENSGELTIDMDEAREDYRHFLQMDEQARKLGYLNELHSTFTHYNRPGGEDVFADSNVTPITIDTSRRR
jgi:hypothetical protein